MRMSNGQNPIEPDPEDPTQIPMFNPDEDLFDEPEDEDFEEDEDEDEDDIDFDDEGEDDAEHKGLDTEREG